MLEVKKNNNILELIGHCDSEVECAKVSAICEILKITDEVEILEYKTGYGKFKFKKPEFKLKVLNLIQSNIELKFAPITVHWYTYDGTEEINVEWSIYPNTLYYVRKWGLEAEDGTRNEFPYNKINGELYGISNSPNSNSVDFPINSTYVIGDAMDVSYYLVGTKDLGLILINFNSGLEYKGIKPENQASSSSTIETLPSLTQDGLTFEGWYYDKSFSRKVNIGDSITEDITLYAKWSHDTLPSLFTGVADTIRAVIGDEEKRIADYFPREIENINDIKEDIKMAISDKGVDMSGVNVFGDYTGKIEEIKVEQEPEFMVVTFHLSDNHELPTKAEVTYINQDLIASKQTVADYEGILVLKDSLMTVEIQADTYCYLFSSDEAKIKTINSLMINPKRGVVIYQVKDNQGILS